MRALQARRLRRRESCSEAQSGATGHVYLGRAITTRPAPKSSFAPRLKQSPLAIADPERNRSEQAAEDAVSCLSAKLPHTSLITRLRQLPFRQSPSRRLRQMERSSVATKGASSPASPLRFQINRADKGTPPGGTRSILAPGFA